MLAGPEPLISIVIPVYNGSDYLKSAIESALDQTYNNIEIIIVNDGSDDFGQTERIALSYGCKVRYYYKENGGVATALNYAISVMNGEYFSWLSHDDLYKKDKIETEIGVLRETGSAMTIVFSDYEVLDMRTGDTVVIHGEDSYSNDRLEYECFPVVMGMVSGTTLLFHRKHFDRVGLFNEKLDTTQDYDMWFRLFRNQSIKHVNCPLVTVRHHDNQGSKTKVHHKSERDDLFVAIVKQLTNDERKRIFGGNELFLNEMIRKSVQWELPKFYQEARKELLALDNPPCLENILEELKAAIYAKLSKNCDTLYLFGSGQIGRRLLFDMYVRGIKIHGFIDNDIKKHGKYIGEVPCKPLSEVRRKDGIIVAIKENANIIKQLSELGYYNVICDYREIERMMANVPIDKKRLKNFYGL